MNYFGKIISNISQAYSEINPATLTGAIDVIIVEQEDGSYLCSPFHVRFGKMGVLRSKEKIVDIEINGVPVDIHMRLGDSGEAYFLEELDEDDENNLPTENEDTTFNDMKNSCNNSLEESHSSGVPTNNSDHCDKENLNPDVLPSENIKQSVNDDKLDSVIFQSNTSSPEKNSQKRTRRKKKSKLNANKLSSQSDYSKSTQHIESSLEPNLERESEPECQDELLNSPYTDSELHPFSDSEVSCSQTKYKHESFDCKSDSEYEIYKSNVDDKSQGQDNISWDWGELPNIQKDSSIHSSAKKDLDNSKSPRSSVLSGVLNFINKDKEENKDEQDKGIYLDQLDPNDMNPEVAAKYFPKFHSNFSGKHLQTTSSDEDIESGNGPSLSNSPQSGEFNYLQLDYNEFNEKVIDSYDFVTLNRIYHDMSMSLCGRIEDLVSNPSNSERFLQSIISFDDFSENPLEYIDNPNLVIRMGGKYHTWKMACSIIFSLLMYQRHLPSKTMDFLKDKCIPKKNSAQASKSWRSWFRSNTNEASHPVDETTYPTNAQINSSENSSAIDSSSFNSSLDNSKSSLNKSNTLEYISDDETLNILMSNGNKNGEDSKSNTGGLNKKVKYKKVLRLQSDIIKSLNLKPNSNDVMFSVTTAYQGTTICKSKIFLWRYDDKVVISDIDGTITKSDVLGHILPYIGKDWAQNGVAKLFTNIQNNGYKFLYLSARAIGQAKGTREYLGALRQDEVSLPDGPLLLSPTSLFSALHREVIDKKPEEFKISCLKDIQTLFPKNPFFAGFGNKINDTWAYKAVCIDSSRIFTINHKGELKLDKILSFKSSYSDLSFFVDQMFPTLNQNVFNDSYSSFLYWRSEIPQLDDNDLLK